MNRPTLYITRLLPQPVLDALPPQYRLLTTPSDDPPTHAELRRGCAEADAVICTLSDHIDASVLRDTTRLKIITNYAVGYNNIDVAAATARGIVVSNTPDVLTDATADLTWALLLAVSRRVAEGDRWVRTSTWPGFRPARRGAGRGYGRLACGGRRRRRRRSIRY